MNFRSGLPMALAVLLLAWPAPATAQGGSMRRGIELALRTGRDFDDDAWMAGGGLRIPLPGRWEFRPSGDVLLKDGSPWQANLDVAVTGVRGAGYIGVGYARVHRVFEGDVESDSDGVNAFLGFSTVVPATIRPFLEARFTRAGGETLFRLVLGFNI
ncbi:MAG: hypothetical protein ACREL6_09395 [Gemmatimonadales bacterium]